MVFSSRSSNLVPGDSTNVIHAFVRDSDCYMTTIAKYCTAQTNSAGCVPDISATGVPSASAGSGFTIGATNVIPNQLAHLFYGISGPAAVPYNGGMRCVADVFRPLPFAMISSGKGTPCSGVLSTDFNAFVSTGIDPGLVAGQTVWAQWWSRDPGAPLGTNLTDAVWFTLCP